MDLTSAEFAWYLKHNCTPEKTPHCSDCNTANDDIYNDELDGEMYCPKCLLESLNKDEDARSELRLIMKKELK